MKFALAFGVLILPVTLSAAAEKSPAFKVIEVQQTGGFAGVNISYRITPDGKFTRKSRLGTVDGKLDTKETEALKHPRLGFDVWTPDSGPLLPQTFVE